MQQTGPKTPDQVQSPLPGTYKTFGELRARPAQQKKEEDKQRQFIFLRMMLHQAFQKVFDETWLCPPQGEMQDINIKAFRFCKKAAPTNGCSFALEQSFPTFALLSLEQDSIEGLRRCVEAYVDAYQRWCPPNETNLEFDLIVYDESHIQPILNALDALKQPLTHVTIVDPRTKNEVKLTREQIDAYRGDKAKNNDEIKQKPQPFQ